MIIDSRFQTQRPGCLLLIKQLVSFWIVLASLIVVKGGHGQAF